MSPCRARARAAAVASVTSGTEDPGVTAINHLRGEERHGLVTDRSPDDPEGHGSRKLRADGRMHSGSLKERERRGG